MYFSLMLYDNDLDAIAWRCCPIVCPHYSIREYHINHWHRTHHSITVKSALIRPLHDTIRTKTILVIFNRSQRDTVNRITRESRDLNSAVIRCVCGIVLTTLHGRNLINIKKHHMGRTKHVWKDISCSQNVPMHVNYPWGSHKHHACWFLDRYDPCYSNLARGHPSLLHRHAFTSMWIIIYMQICYRHRAPIESYVSQSWCTVSSF